jgi:hypothetical protein
MLLKFSVFGVLLLRMTACGELVEPTATLPNVSAVSDRLTEGPVAVPVRLRVTGTELKLFEMLTVPALVPGTVGENVVLIVHVPPGARGDAETQVSVSEKSPVVEILNILKG